MGYRQVIRGLATYIPGIAPLLKRGSGGTRVARYCYSIWLRHLVMARVNGLNPFPRAVAELGPGDSLGIGLAALLSGGERYFAFDVVATATAKRNLKVFDQLVGLFAGKTDIPGDAEFPKVKPHLEGYDFPADVLDADRMRRALEQGRLQRIRRSITEPGGADSMIQYRVPWHDVGVIEPHSLDMIFSQAVLEHVDDLENAYRAMRMWLKPEGYISHQIDFKSHDTADQWNGHWAYSDRTWKLIRAKRPYLLNREPHSAHIAILEKEGFEVVCDQVVKTESQLARSRLAPRFRSMSDEDLTISGAFIQAKVRATRSSP